MAEWAVGCGRRRRRAGPAWCSPLCPGTASPGRGGGSHLLEGAGGAGRAGQVVLQGVCGESRQLSDCRFRLSAHVATCVLTPAHVCARTHLRAYRMYTAFCGRTRTGLWWYLHVGGSARASARTERLRSRVRGDGLQGAQGGPTLCSECVREGLVLSGPRRPCPPSAADRALGGRGRWRPGAPAQGSLGENTPEASVTLKREARSPQVAAEGPVHTGGLSVAAPSSRRLRTGTPPVLTCRAQQTPAWLQPVRSPGRLPGPTGPCGGDTGSGRPFLGLWAPRGMEGRAGRTHLAPQVWGPPADAETGSTAPPGPCPPRPQAATEPRTRAGRAVAPRLATVARTAVRALPALPRPPCRPGSLLPHMGAPQAEVETAPEHNKLKPSLTRGFPGQRGLAVPRGPLSTPRLCPPLSPQPGVLPPPPAPTLLGKSRQLRPLRTACRLHACAGSRHTALQAPLGSGCPVSTPAPSGGHTHQQPKAAQRPPSSLLPTLQRPRVKSRLRPQPALRPPPPPLPSQQVYVLPHEHSLSLLQSLCTRHTASSGSTLMPPLRQATLTTCLSSHHHPLPPSLAPLAPPHSHLPTPGIAGLTVPVLISTASHSTASCAGEVLPPPAPAPDRGSVRARVPGLTQVGLPSPAPGASSGGHRLTSTQHRVLLHHPGHIGVGIHTEVTGALGWM